MNITIEPPQETITTVGFRQDLRRNRAGTIHEAEAGDAPVLSEEALVGNGVIAVATVVNDGQMMIWRW